MGKGLQRQIRFPFQSAGCHEKKFRSWNDSAKVHGDDGISLMDTYPFDLVLAVAVAAATIFVGFLPVKTIPARFFAREAIKAAGAWMLVAAISPLGVMHYPFILAILCFVAWWNFQRDDTFTGKIWFSLASGLGISIGVMIILAITPGSLPVQGDWSQILCLLSIYLGGAMTGLAYVGCMLCREASVRTGITGLTQNCLGLLFNLVLIRCLVLLIEFTAVPGSPCHDIFSLGAKIGRQPDLLPIAISVFFITPLLAYLARRAANFSSRLQPARFLVAIIFIGFMTEILARIAHF